MTILIDLTSLADNFSGIERYAASISYEMISNSEDKYILLFKNELHSMFKEFQQNARIKMVVLQECNKLLFNQFVLPYEICKHKADWYLFLAFPVPVILFKRNMLSVIHDICCWDCPETMNISSKWYFRISLRIAMIKCKKIITVSEFSRNRIVDRFNYNKDKTLLIYCGISRKLSEIEIIPTQFNRIMQKYKMPNEYILSLSTLEPRKNIQFLIDVYQELFLEGNISIPLVLAGRKGWKTEKLLNDICDSVRRNIIFTGFIDDDDLPYIYKNAEIFIFPSKYEGFGIPPLEALHFGCPVISSNAASMPEVLQDQVIYFNLDEQNSLKELLSKLNNIKSNMPTGLNDFQKEEFSFKSSSHKLLSFLHNELKF